MNVKVKKKAKEEIFEVIENKGITLIALVITIIVLLILAGVALATLTGENGILTQANRAQTETTKVSVKEQVELEVLGSYGADGNIDIELLNKNLKNITNLTYNGKEISEDESNRIETLPVIVALNGYDIAIDANGKIKELNELEKAKIKGTVFEDNTTLTDVYGNFITIPEGFKIANDSATEVTRGIVIEDATYINTVGSQFVWIPVGDIRASDGSTKTIELNRYTFDSDGTPTTQGTNVIKNSYQELSTSLYGNSVAKNLYGFIASVDNNYGYYLGRYEMGTDTQRTSSSDELTQVKVQENKYVYNYVTQSQASTLSQNMYTSDSFTSDLINSYAWDTAIVFIQKFSGCENYSMQKNTNYTPVKTGMSTIGTNYDVRCNIYDMGANCFEWSTETCTGSYGPGTYRAGMYAGYVPSGRDYSDFSYSYKKNLTLTSQVLSFRPLLYL